jgi:hypothetical protein
MALILQAIKHLKEYEGKKETKKESINIFFYHILFHIMHHHLLNQYLLSTFEHGEYNEIENDGRTFNLCKIKTDDRNA